MLIGMPPELHKSPNSVNIFTLNSAAFFSTGAIKKIKIKERHTEYGTSLARPFHRLCNFKKGEVPSRIWKEIPQKCLTSRTSKTFPAWFFFSCQNQNDSQETLPCYRSALWSTASCSHLTSLHQCSHQLWSHAYRSVVGMRVSRSYLQTTLTKLKSLAKVSIQANTLLAGTSKFLLCSLI